MMVFPFSFSSFPFYLPPFPFISFPLLFSSFVALFPFFPCFFLFLPSFPFELKLLIFRERFRGSAVGSYIAGSGAEPQLKTVLVHYSLKTRHWRSEKYKLGRKGTRFFFPLFPFSFSLLSPFLFFLLLALSFFLFSFFSSFRCS